MLPLNIFVTKLDSKMDDYMKNYLNEDNNTTQRTASSAPHPAHRIPVRDPTDSYSFRRCGGVVGREAINP